MQSEDAATELALAKDDPVARRATSGDAADIVSGGAAQQPAAAMRRLAPDAELRHVYAACVRECLSSYAERDAILVRPY